jgi:CHRD domain
MAAKLVMRFSLRTRGLTASAALACIAFAANGADAYKVRLTPVPIEASTSAATKGIGNASASLDGATLRVSGSFSGLQGAATMARLHEGAVTGVRGPAVADFTVPQAASGSFTASFTLTPAQLESLRQGRLYLQIHSAAAPDGNLWGWLLP